MKKILEILGALFGAFLWLLDFDNILWYILIPGGILVWGLLEGYSWSYYLIAYGIYTAVNIAGHLLGKRFDRWMDRRLSERESRKK